jgi:predicted N-acyltransferase
MKRVEAGAQGEHKIQRGYLPRPTYSAHAIRHPGLKRAVAEYLAHEQAQMDELLTAMAAEGPYRKTQTD